MFDIVITVHIIDMARNHRLIESELIDIWSDI